MKLKACMGLNFLPLRSIKTRITLLTLSIFIVSVWALAFFVSRSLRQDMQALLGQQQLATASLLAAEINHHLADRLQSLKLVAKSLSPAFSGSSAAVQSALDDQPLLLNAFNGGAVVVNTQGTVIAEVPAVGRIGANYMEYDHIVGALKDAQATIGKPIRGGTLRSPLLAMAVPIRNTQGAVIGAISGVNLLDQPNYLNPISEAGFGRTGAYLLVAPQHGLVVTSTIKSRILAELPPPGVNQLVDRSRRGFEGTTIDVEPMGDEVLASVKQVPMAGWFVAVRITTAEAFAPIAAMQQRLLLATLALTLLVGLLTWWALRRQLAPMLRSVQTMSRMTDGSAPLRPLAVERADEVGQMVQGFNQLLATLQQREELLQRIFDTASVAIFLIDKDQRIRQANQRMASLFGCPLASLEGRGYLELVHPEERKVAGKNTSALIASALPSVDLTRRYLRADQTAFWGHLTCRSYVEGDGSEPTLVCVIADITERQEALVRNQRLTQLYAALSQSNDAIVHSSDDVALFDRVCRVLVQVGGMKTAFVGRGDAQQICQVAGFGPGVEELAAASLPLAPDAPARRGLTASAWCSAAPVWCQDCQADPSNADWHATAARLGWASAAALPLFRDDQVVAVLTLFAAHANAFDDDMRRLLLEMTTNISFALAGFARDAARHASQQKMSALLESVHDAIVTADSAGLIVGWNHAAEAMFGYPAQEVLGRDMTLLMPARFQPDHQAGMQRLRADEPPRVLGKLLELAGLRKNGEEFPLELSLARWDSVEGWFVTGVIRDITERKVQHQRLQLAQRVFAQAQEGIVVTNANADILMVNQAFARITGYTQEEAVGKNPRILQSDRQDRGFYQAMWQALTTDGHWTGEIWNKKKDGTIYPEWLAISALHDGDGLPTHYVANFTDLSAAKEAETHLQWLSSFDPLTGLPNRTLLQDRTRHALSMVQRAHEPLTLLLVSIDHLGSINDTLGHQQGDQMLIEVAQRLSQSVRAQDTVARLAGKEFVLVLPGTEGAGAAHLAGELLTELARPYHLQTKEVSATASIGIACYPDDGQDFDALLKAVEMAMHRAKDEGRNRLQFYSSELDEKVQARESMTRALRQAAALGQLHLAYQPQVDLHSGKICGLEALLRWNHPDFGAVSPAQFIPLAEQAGLIMDIGEWVLRRACGDIRQWLDAGLPVPTVSVNVSPLQFSNNDLLQQVSAALHASQVDAGLLYIEVTESALMDDVPRNEAMLRELKALGVKLSLDDFGTGYSSLSYLKRFPFDQIKVDQSFVRNITSNVSDQMLVKVIVSMAHGFGMRVIAEGVETEAQCHIVRDSLCDELQGYFFSRPITFEAVQALLREQRQLPHHLLRAQPLAP